MKLRNHLLIALQFHILPLILLIVMTQFTERWTLELSEISSVKKMVKKIRALLQAFLGKNGCFLFYLFFPQSQTFLSHAFSVDGNAFILLLVAVFSGSVCEEQQDFQSPSQNICPFEAHAEALLFKEPADHHPQKLAFLSG